MLTHTTQTRLKVTLPIGLPPGTQVWFTACWLGRGLRMSCPATPLKTWVQFGLRVEQTSKAA